ncbi:unnamed protein product, partial [Allacma fusca]
DNNNKKR